MEVVVLTSTRLSWSSSSAVEISRFLASFCTVLIGTCLPALLGCTELRSSANATASPIDATSRKRASGSLNKKRLVPPAKSPSATSTGLRRWARPLRTARRDAGSPLPLLEPPPLLDPAPRLGWEGL